MADETPQNPREGLPPVRMALRVIGRHGHRGGPHLARAVAGARAPKHLDASTRLARHAAAEAHAPAAAPPGTSAAPAASGFAAPEDPGLTEFAKEFLFGDAGAAASDLTSMAQAEKMNDPASAKEARLARRRARGALDVSRAAKILEGPSSGAPVGEEETALPDVPAPAGPVPAPAPAPVKVSRTPADPPKPPSAP